VNICIINFRAPWMWTIKDSWGFTFIIFTTFVNICWHFGMHLWSDIVCDTLNIRNNQLLRIATTLWWVFVSISWLVMWIYKMSSKYYVTCMPFGDLMCLLWIVLNNRWLILRICTCVMWIIMNIWWLMINCKCLMWVLVNT
jgi:hypothetical protein